MRRRIAAIAVAGALLVGLTACGDPTDTAGIEHRAKVVKQCHDAGGVWLSDSWGNQSCNFDDYVKKVTNGD